MGVLQHLNASHVYACGSFAFNPRDAFLVSAAVILVLSPFLFEDSSSLLAGCRHPGHDPPGSCPGSLPLQPVAKEQRPPRGSAMTPHSGDVKCISPAS